MKVFGVGTGKSGTTTLAAMFQPAYRSSHEAELATMVPLAAAVAEGRQDPAEVEAILMDRHERLRLEVDVAGFLNPLVPDLLTLFPHSRYILTIRNCFDWLESRVDQRVRMVQQGTSPPVHLRDADRRSYDEPYETDDQWLADLGLPSARGLLHRWADANARVLQAVPPARLLVIRTEDLDASVPRLAAFTGCPADRLTVTRANVRPVRTDAIGSIDRSRLIAHAEEHGRELMEQHWGPGWRDLAPR